LAIRLQRAHVNAFILTFNVRFVSLADIRACIS